jgi:L-fucono-1,5-lactonase
MMRGGWIDTHHHLWHYNDQQYPWMSEEMISLRRDFLTPELEVVARACDVRATIAVQARQRIEETDFLLASARESSLIRGVVGWVPLVDRNVEIHLDRYAQETHFKGVRHVLHDEADAFYMLREDFNDGIAKLLRYNLCYDLLVFARHLPQTITFVDRHPRQIFILDHIAKPQIATGKSTAWAINIKELAKRDNVFCKISGMTTEAVGGSWNADLLKPYFDVVLDAFSPARLMFGSDWPVLTIASDYERWLRVVASWLNELSVDEAEAIQYRTAAQVYRL